MTVHHDVRVWSAILKIIKFLIAPLLLAQSLAFASFIYEEALQATSFGVRAAMQCEDATLARDAMARFRSLMLRAQAFQKKWGHMAFWSHGAFQEYFSVAAPTQLMGMYADGKRIGLWGEYPGRWVEVLDHDGNGRMVDRWALDPDAKFRDFGFDVKLLHKQENIATPEVQRSEKMAKARHGKVRN